MNYRRCYVCGEKFYYDSNKLHERFKVVYKLAWHETRKHKNYIAMIKTILATLLYPFIPVLWVVHKILYPFWVAYEWLDNIDCM